MPPGDHAETDAVREALTCPSCDYLLRGLEGDIVTCPECGTQSDLAKLVATRWTRPWFRAPLMEHLLRPIVVASLALPLMLALSSAGTSVSGGNGLAMLIAGSAVAISGLSLWTFTVNRTRRLFDHMEGPLLVLLAHGVVLAYLIAIWTALVGIFKTVWGSSTQATIGHPVAQGVGLIAAACAVLFAAVVCHRFMAKRCIRAYLRRKHANHTT